MQIAEPGQSTVKEACKQRVVGIDLGTTNSLVAYVADASPAVIAGEGGPLVPSVVHYAKDGSVLVGKAAEAKAVELPRETINSVKRLIGRGMKDVVDFRAMLPYEIEGDDRAISVKVSGTRLISPVEISAEVLRELKRRAETSLGGPIEGVVITVPAYFDDAQRQATRDAGRLAGLEVMRLLAEPTAAAVAYGLDRGAGPAGRYAVYDLGGGTFDISILKLVDGVFEVKATGGDSALGGDDLDRAIASGITNDALSIAPRGLVAQAVREARRVKEALSDAESVEFHLHVSSPAHARADVVGGSPGMTIVHELITANAERIYTICGDVLPSGVARLTSDRTTCVGCVRAAGTFVRTIDRQRLAAFAAPLLDRTAKACRRVLKDAELEKSELDGVILVGGSTRSPVVRDFVTALFDRPILSDLDPEQVVALGAAVQADVLAGGQQNVTLLDVVPLSLGVEMMGGVVEKLIHRNTTIPAGATQTFTTYADNQTGFDIHVLQGERETVDACRSLARFMLKGLPPMVAGMLRVEITFLIDADGLLKVLAKELTTGTSAEVDVKPSYGLSDEEVERMLIESFDFAEEDLAKRNLAVERVEANRILQATRGAFASDAALFDDPQVGQDVKTAGETAMGVLEAAINGEDHLAIRHAIEGLDLATKPFAQARMNRAITAGFQGVSLDEAEAKMAPPKGREG
ncbi:MAG: Hsp70 family protein [Deltaproteobacteria bacterium]|nr:Hsp70 family protein [Deltaproteobacteria bacterium]